MSDVLRAIFQLIIWIAVPAILLVTLVKSNSITRKIEHKIYKSAAHSGFIGGFVLFLIFLIYELGQFTRNGFPDAPIYQGFSLPAAVTSMLLTYAIFYGGRALPAKLVGWVVLIISFLSFWALFHYLFIHTSNYYILSVVLGIAFGVFSHTAFSPVTIDDLIKFF